MRCYSQRNQKGKKNMQRRIGKLRMKREGQAGGKKVRLTTDPEKKKGQGGMVQKQKDKRMPEERESRQRNRKNTGTPSEERAIN